ncbi:chemotaxis protein CheB [Polyangium aurulentum]|uniref:chemotaxis protein CheB n=1 Tax=Polyangium aurulentum TaxID=2567896 RepID=UPI0010AE0ACD|nr:chemotaxis protein CheB [Polyangium aurulentum]UQA63397.1 chemotaxis protein CheB [Polyangium aurulentum]
MSSRPPPEPPFLVAIGGSAGAVEVLLTLLPALPASFPGALVVVIHLRPQVRSLLPSIFAGHIALSVREADDKDPIEAGTVTFAGPDYHLLVEPGGSFSLCTTEPVHFSRPSIDVLFESAAHTYGRRLLGILLSGANEDGAAGLAAIARAGGRTWVQAPETAGARRMPESALACMSPDRVLSPSAMAEALRSLSELE